ncbi:MAG: hypothetical protein ABSC56_06205 [Solirubrobacteraceae bacterium]|jgi:hypothetical protein
MSCKTTKEAYAVKRTVPPSAAQTPSVWLVSVMMAWVVGGVDGCGGAAGVGIAGQPSVGLGAYGLRVGGLDGAERWLVSQSAAAGRLDVVSMVGRVDDSPHVLSEDFASLRLLDGGRLRIDRGELVARFTFPRKVSAADLLHPYLAVASGLVWAWSGREALHAGAFVVGDGAVLMLGAGEAGKSSTLAFLAGERGVGVLSDDLVVLEAERALVGPRCVDVRPDVPAVRSVAVRGNERLRVDLDPVVGPVAVRAIVVLAWGEALSLREVALRERFGLLAAQRSVPSSTADPSVILGLVGVPMLALTRPRGLAGLPAGVDLLLDYLA